ncbi:MAG: hypothetical protein LBR26_04305 [Prevotella sp.]|jgi:hypothetical protein|nr:hypothetical protein [Prevotella sp.]
MKSISEQFALWKSALDDFQKNVEKDLDEIRKEKSEVQQMKNAILDRMDSGQYIRDEKRIVLSAPEIVIGNVDHSGVLWDKLAPSRITIRGNNVALEAVGVGGAGTGTIVSRAGSIRTIAVDPGKDGLEEVAGETSEIVMQARNIGLVSDSAADFFAERPFAGTGIRIHSDKQVDIEATPSCELRETLLKDKEKGLNGRADALKKTATNEKKEIETLMKQMEDLVGQPDLDADQDLLRSNFVDLEERHAEFQALSTALYDSMTGYFRTLSLLAETNRQATSVKTQSDGVSKLKSDFAKQSTGAGISLRAERVDVASVDGDGNFRTNPEAGVSMQARNLSFAANNFDGSLAKDGMMSISAQTVSVSTVNPKMEKENADYPAAGDVIVTSKNITLEAVDRELKDKKIQEKALTAGGTLSVRAEKIDVSATDTEGKAAGQVSVNAKALEIKSMDVDKDKRTDKSLAAGSTLLLLAEKMFAGGKDKDNKSKSVQVSSDKVGVFAKTTLELQQDEGKSLVQMEGGNLSVSGGKTALFGETTVNGKATFKADVKAGTVELDNIKIGTSFKSPCTSEGVAMPAPPSTAQLSAKLKEEDAPAGKEQS